MIRALIPAMFLAAPVHAEIEQGMVQSACVFDPGDLAPALGLIVHGPVLMEGNEAGYAPFTIEGEERRAIGFMREADGRLCIVWSARVEGAPS